MVHPSRILRCSILELNSPPPLSPVSRQSLRPKKLRLKPAYNHSRVSVDGDLFRRSVCLTKRMQHLNKRSLLQSSGQHDPLTLSLGFRGMYRSIEPIALLPPRPHSQTSRTQTIHPNFVDETGNYGLCYALAPCGSAKGWRRWRCQARSRSSSGAGRGWTRLRSGFFVRPARWIATANTSTIASEGEEGGGRE